MTTVINMPPTDDVTAIPEQVTPAPGPAKAKKTRKPLSLRAWLLKKLRMLFIGRKLFVGTYADTEIEIRKFISDGNYKVMRVVMEKGILKHDFHLRNTSARKICQKRVWYYSETYLTDLLKFHPGLDHYLYT